LSETSGKGLQMLREEWGAEDPQVRRRKGFSLMHVSELVFFPAPDGSGKKAASEASGSAASIQKKAKGNRIPLSKGMTSDLIWLVNEPIFSDAELSTIGVESRGLKREKRS